MSWIVRFNRRSAKSHPDLAFDARFVVGRRTKTTAGFVAAAMNGTPSIREECARPVSINGPKPSAFRAVGGRCTRIGMAINGEKPQRVHAPQPLEVLFMSSNWTLDPCASRVADRQRAPICLPRTNRSRG